ncbi:MAG: quinol:cytochrome C oxidoreductase [Acidobacteria bacterium]|nr:quinol:cytochrome C oxidoreductase [Acidobacteriota bacterium]MBI3488936.1 quinol:cytochrome C oxidoreductase [Acidobacteriota bacterium]
MSQNKTASQNKPASPLLLGATALGALGVIGSYAAAGHERFWANWILWFVLLFTLGLGALFIVALEHLVSARWSVPVRRIPERLATLLIPAIPVGLIGLLALPVLYPGTRPEAAHHPILAGKAFWLSIPFFSVRTLVAFALCLLGLALLVGGSLKQDATKNPAFNIRARKFAPAFMAIFALVITLIAFDWISGLTPEWYSDIFGVYVFAGAFLSGLAATALSVLYLQDQGRLEGVKGDHLYNLGAFLFAFTVFWSYIGFAQYMLMWYANLPDEVIYYKVRLAGSWRAITIALASLHFVIPFFALVTRDAKKDPKRLRRVAYLMLGAHVLDMYWLIFPVLGVTPHFSWPEISFALFFIGGIVLWVRGAMQRGEDMPVGDPFLREGLEFRL